VFDSKFIYSGYFLMKRKNKLMVIHHNFGGFFVVVL